MPKVILREIDLRLHQIKDLEKQAYLSEEQKRCLQSRRSELENIKKLIKERLGKNEMRKVSNHEFWKLVDEF